MIDAQMAEKIKSQVRERKEQFNAMSRTKLKEEFLRITGKEAHPRFSKEWLVLALTRIFQMRLWSREAGFIPTEIAEGDVKFWLSNTVMLVRRDTLAQEKREEKRAEKIKKVSLDGNSPNIDVLPARNTTIKWIKSSGKGKVVNPFSKNDPVESAWYRFFNALKRHGEMDWDAVSKWCRRDPAHPSPSVVYMTMKEMKFCEIAMTSKEETELNRHEPFAQEIISDWPEDKTENQNDSTHGPLTIPNVEASDWIDPNEETEVEEKPAE